MTDISHLIRQSEFSTWDFCRRLHNLQYTRRLSPQHSGRRMPDKGQRDIGTVYHAGVEEIHLGHSFNSAMLAITEKVHELRHIREGFEVPDLTPDLDPEWYKLQELCLIMLEGYVEWLGNEGIDAGNRTLAVEQPFEVALGETGVSVYGTWDLVQHNHKLGGVTVDDGKTVGPLDIPHPSDFQMRTYSWAWWKHTGEAPVAARHRQARRVRRSATAKPPFYAVPQIPITETIMEAHEAQLIERAQDIMTARTRDTADPMLYPRTSRDCSWRCAFKDICAMVDDGDDIEFVLEQNYYVRETQDDND